MYYLCVPQDRIVIHQLNKRNKFSPPVMLGVLTLPRWAPRAIGKVYFRLFDGLGALLLDRELNQLRASLGLKRERRIFQWWFSPELVISMFREWIAEPQRDWPRQIKLAGLPLYDSQPNPAM